MEQTNTLTQPKHNYIGFDKHTSVISVGNTKGFKLITLTPHMHSISKNFENESILLIQAYYQSNIVAFTSKRKTTAQSCKLSSNSININNYNCNKDKDKPKRVLHLFDMNSDTKISEFRFKSKIRNFRLAHEKIIVLCKTEWYVFNIFTFVNIDYFITDYNPFGWFSWSDNNLIAYPNEKQGVITIKKYSDNSNICIHADENSVNCISWNSNGTWLAVAVEHGLIIKVFNIENNGIWMKILKRGKHKAIIGDISFDYNSSFIMITSTQGTVHIWNWEKSRKELKVKEANHVSKDNDNNNNNTGIFKRLFSFNSSSDIKYEKSAAKLHLKEEQCLCGFTNNYINCKDKNTWGITIIGSSGIVYESVIDIKTPNKLSIKRQFNILI